jgi:hypothetical protein
MPTPIQHLALARDILASDLPVAVRHRLEAHWEAHLLGHIAPDAQNKSGQRREDTHFFTMPPGMQPPAHEQMFATYPALARASGLEPAQAIFVAGYLSHLFLDELWIRQVFMPYFGPDARWGTFSERLLIHNVLRTWLDRQDLSRLVGDENKILRQAHPDHWLPFLADSALVAWRDEIANQLSPGASVHTAEVFAARARISPVEFNRLLTLPGEVERRVFAHIPQERIWGVADKALASSRELIAAYLEDQLCRL